MTLHRLLPFALIVAALSASASERIAVTPSGGVYAVPVQINGALTIDFLLDTGASEVIIPADVALTLVRTGTIDRSDILGAGQYVLADGSIVENTKINLRTLKIGPRILHNVRGAIGGVESPLLLGQTALRELEPWRLDTRTGHLVFLDPDAAGSGYATSTPAPEPAGQRRVTTVTPAPVANAPHEIYLSGWTADRNAAVVGSHAPGSLDGLGVNFPLDGEGARIVICSGDPSLKGRAAVEIEMNVDGVLSASGTAHASPRSQACWNAYLPENTLYAIKHGSLMWVSVADRSVYRADLTGSAKAMNKAWAYVAERLPEEAR